jgi:RHS repeat-associated protein
MVTVEHSSTEPQLYDLTSVTMVYDQGNRLISYAGQDVEYDADGNMTFGPLNGQMVEYSYDSRNRLIQAGDTEYIYDAENTRIASIQGGVRTDYVTNPHAQRSQLLVENTNGIEIYYIYGIGLVGHQAEDTYYTYHFDIRGSTTAITNQQGDVIDRFHYGPYGELVSQEGTTKTPFLYNGRDGVQTSNGLFYMRARYYNPEIKRFINQDVVMGDISNGSSLNRYAYAGGNPVTMVDPFGLSPEYSSSSTYGTLFAWVGGFLSGGGATGRQSFGEFLFGKLYSKITSIPVIGTGIKWGAKAYNAVNKWVSELSPATKIVISTVAIIFTTVVTGGTATVPVLTAAFKAAAVGVTMGGITGGISGYIDGGWKGALKGALAGAIEGGATGFMFGAFGSSIKETIKFANSALQARKTATLTGDNLDDFQIDLETHGVCEGASKAAKGAGSAGKGFNTFNDAKKFLGSPGEGKQWHHIVEQSQINKSGFSSTQIQNTNNLIAVDSATHAKISGYYSSKQAFTGGKTVRDWLAGQSYGKQFEFGMQKLRDFGVIK